MLLASQNGHAAVVQVLLDGGARTDTAASHGATALMAASESGKVACVRTACVRA